MTSVSPWSDMQLVVGWLVLAATPTPESGVPEGRRIGTLQRRIGLCNAIGDRADELASERRVAS